jgi:uncharacterized phosphosugar-binding protein
MSAATAYLDAALAALSALKAASLPEIEAAADAMARAVADGGRIYVFGTGHSHMLAEEAHYRAGGLAAVVPVLATAFMLHEGAAASTAIERTPGVASVVLSRYPIGKTDVVVVISNSGVNAAPVEAAKHARMAGARVIAVTSVAYSTQAAKGRTTLFSLADIVLDTGAPPGDAAIAIEGLGVRAGPLSTLLGAALINAALVGATGKLARMEGGAPVYLSANMPGADEVNAALIARFKPGNPHL